MQLGSIEFEIASNPMQIVPIASASRCNPGGLHLRLCQIRCILDESIAKFNWIIAEFSIESSELLIRAEEIWDLTREYSEP